MRLVSTPESSYRSSTPSGEVDDAKLGRAVVVAQLALLTWCAARAATDWSRGPLGFGFESAVALALGGLLVVFLTLRLVEWTARRPFGTSSAASSVRDGSRPPRPLPSSGWRI